MKTFARRLTISGLALFVLAMSGPHPTARSRSTECLELGSQDQSGGWAYHHAWIESMTDNKCVIRFDYNHGKLDLKIDEKQKSGGEDIYVMSGRWIEGRGREKGRVSLRMESKSHRATGWYMYGDTGSRFDMVLRVCHG